MFKNCKHSLQKKKKVHQRTYKHLIHYCGIGMRPVVFVDNRWHPYYAMHMYYIVPSLHTTLLDWREMSAVQYGVPTRGGWGSESPWPKLLCSIIRRSFFAQFASRLMYVLHTFCEPPSIKRSWARNSCCVPYQ